MGVPDFCARWRAFNALQVVVDAEVSVASMSHRTVRCTPDSPVNYSGLAVANSRSWRVPELLFLGAPDTVRCTPDSPVNYSGAPLYFPEGDEFDLESSGAPDTVWWCIGHCPVAHRTVRCARPEVPSVVPLLFC
jgi:hypothetical protein